MTTQPHDQAAGSPAMPPPPPPSTYPGGQPLGATTADDRTWAAGAHVGSLLAAWFALGVLAPVLVLVLRGNHTSFVRQHAYESLNFQLNTYLWMIAAFVFGVLTLGIGWVSYLAIGAWYGIFVIIASVAANRGEAYRYPLIIRFFRP